MTDFRRSLKLYTYKSKRNTDQMTTQPTTKVTFTTLADMSGSTEQEVKSLLKSHNLVPENLTQVQIDSIKSELTKSIQLKTVTQTPIPKVPTALNGDAPKVTLPVSNSKDLESMTIDEIIQYEKDQDEALQKQKLIAGIKAKKQELIDLREKNLSITLENESAEASYNMRLESQPQLLALSIENAKSLQGEIMEREVKSLKGMTQHKRETPTSFEMREANEKKYQRQGQNRMNLILNSTDELIPTMRIAGRSEKQIQTVEI